jgi:hypothetical protein
MELMSIPGIGAKVADKILELREAKGDLELDDLNQVPYLGITQPLLDCLDFTSFENKEGMGSLYGFVFPSHYNHHLISRVNWPVATNPFPVYYNMIFPLLTGLYQMYPYPSPFL